MSKAAPADVDTLGFKAEQFGTPANWVSAGGYLQKVLDDVAVEVKDRVGDSFYASAISGINFKRLKTAEIYLAAAELWRRREIVENANVNVSGDAPTLGSRYLENAKEMEDKAWGEIARITGNLESGGIAAGSVETGPYTSSVT